MEEEEGPASLALEERVDGRDLQHVVAQAPPASLNLNLNNNLNLNISMDLRAQHLLPWKSGLMAGNSSTWSHRRRRPATRRAAKSIS